MYFVSVSGIMDTFCHSVTKIESKYGEMIGCMGILVLSLNCQMGSLLILVLANLEFKMEVSKHQDSKHKVRPSRREDSSSRCEF